MSLAKKFYSENAGKIVRLKEEIWQGHGYEWAKNWKGFEAEVFLLRDGENTVEFKITKPCAARKNIGDIIGWDGCFLSILEVVEELIIIPKNNHPCPNCQKLSCKGMDRIECVMRI